MLVGTLWIFIIAVDLEYSFPFNFLFPCLQFILYSRFSNNLENE
jgi:hypothetical protein